MNMNTAFINQPTSLKYWESARITAAIEADVDGWVARIQRGIAHGETEVVDETARALAEGPALDRETVLRIVEALPAKGRKRILDLARPTYPAARRPARGYVSPFEHWTGIFIELGRRLRRRG